MTLGGILLIVVGIVYLKRPEIFRRGVRMKTSIALRTLSEEGYLRYMRRLGVVFLLLGVALIVWDLGKSL